MNVASAVLVFLLFQGDVVSMSDSHEFHEQYTQLIRNAGKESDSSRLHQLFEVAWEHRMAENPEWATAVGHPGYNDRWTDMSFEAIERRKKDLRLQAMVLESIDR